MRYFVRNKTLFIRGDFTAASTGIHGGSGHITTIFNRTVPENWAETDPYRSLKLVASREGYGEDFFGMVTAVEMRNLCILQYDFLTTFITAGVRSSSDSEAGTINIVVCSQEGLSPASLLETIMVATEAKTEALRSL
ncbi:MAG TPA: adenosylcobinamide amidohydrolase, partial [Methanomicrobiales archaeon]|nr:adenosylcobinamide amidohydrolase [Methanomicrobiales archaeon]